MKNAKRWLPGALISLLLIAAILYFVDFGRMLEAVRRADYLLLALAFSTSLLWLAVRAVVWRVLLRNRPSYSNVFFTVGEGYLLNNFLPFRLGEVGRAFLLSRKSDLTFAEIVPTIVIERTVDLAFTASLLLAALPYVVGAEGAGQAALLVGAVVVAGLIVLYVIARNERWMVDQFHKLAARWPALQRFGGSVMESFFAGLSVLTNGWLFLRFLLLMAVNWFIAVIAYFLMVRAFFPNAQLVWGVFALGAAGFGGGIPSLPGSVGTFEGAMSGAIALITHDPSTSLAVALTARLYNYFNSGLVGGVGLMREGQTLSGVYHQLLQLRSKGA